jgi:hypothetical protein
MAFDTSAASEILKTLYLPPVREALNNSTILLSKIEKKEVETVGKNATFPIHYGRNISAGIGVAEGGTLMVAGNQVFKTAVVPLKYLYGRIELTGQAIKATRNDRGAFVRALSSEMKGLTKDFKRALNRQLHGNGLDVLGVTTAAFTATGTLTADDGNGMPYVHIPSGQTIYVDILDPATGASRLTVGANGYPTATWTSATSTAVTLTMVLPASTTQSGGADNDLIVPAHKTASTISGVTPGLSLQMMGIEGIINNTDPLATSTGLHALAVGTYPWWAAQVSGADTAFVDLKTSSLQGLFSKIETNSDFTEDDVEFILCSPQARDKYAEVCIAERRSFNTMKLDNGFKGVSFNGTPIVSDPQCRHGRFYFVVPETMAIYRMSDLEFLEMDGNVWHRREDKDQFTATLFQYADLGCEIRNGNAVLKGVNE